MTRIRKMYRNNRITRMCIYAFGIILFILFPLTSFSHLNNEYKVKAAFTFNFAKFTDWPKDTFADSPTFFSLCVVGDHSIKPAFKKVAGKRIGTRTCVVHFITGPEDASPCQIIFFDRTVESKDISRIIESVKGKPVLTVGETRDMIPLGAMINFFIKKGRIFFEINLDIVAQQQVKLSSNLLKLAVLTNK